MKGLTSLLTPMAGLRTLVAATLVIASATSAQAGIVNFNVNPPGGPVVQVLTFDEQVGNALAQGAVPLINALAGTGGTTAAFAVYYQANVILSDPNGAVINTGSNTFTAVAKFFETATVTAGSNTVTFQNAANQTGSYFDLFAHVGGPIGNNAAGTGFSNGADGNGILIYSASAPGGGPTTGNFTNNGGSVALSPNNTAQQTVSGSGGTSGFFNTVFVNTNWFVNGAGPSISFDTTNILPFKTVNSSALFANLSGAGAGSTFLSYQTPVLGTLNGANGNDIQFQSDASSTFAVPEPASVAMTLMGLAGVGAVALRRRKAATA